MDSEIAPYKDIQSIPPCTDENADQDLLNVKNLNIGLSASHKKNEFAFAVKNLSFSLRKGKTLCLVGESGCGKTMTALSLLQLLPEPKAKILSGQALFAGKDLFSLSKDELLRIRGNQIGMIFQDPMASLNPVIRVGKQISEMLILHKKMPSAQANNEAVSFLHKVGIPSPAQCAKSFPHQLSGGMRQRVMIAMAICCSPSLLIADEPTTALDLTIQRKILTLIKKLISDANMGLLLISHDLAMVAEYADSIAVMYAGKIVEQGSSRDVLENPKHPYTQGLLACRTKRTVPSTSSTQSQRSMLHVIHGTAPDIWNRPAGCEFHARCNYAKSICKQEVPPPQSIVGVNEPHSTYCHFFGSSS